MDSERKSTQVWFMLDHGFLFRMYQNEWFEERHSTCSGLRPGEASGSKNSGRASSDSWFGSFNPACSEFSLEREINKPKITGVHACFLPLVERKMVDLGKSHFLSEWSDVTHTPSWMVCSVLNSVCLQPDAPNCLWASRALRYKAADGGNINTHVPLAAGWTLYGNSKKNNTFLWLSNNTFKLSWTSKT